MSRVNIIEKQGTETVVDLEKAVKELFFGVNRNNLNYHYLKLVLKTDLVERYPNIVNELTDIIKNTDIKNTFHHIGIEIKDEYISFMNEKRILLTNGSTVLGYFNYIIISPPMLDIQSLNDIMIMEDPEYLLMSTNTLSLLTNAVPEMKKEVSKKTGSFYHKYCNVPIAITEVLNPGIIEIVRLVKNVSK